MSTISEYEQYLVNKLLNSLKGSALSVKSVNDMMMTPQQRLEALEAIGKMKAYIEAYEQRNIVQNIEQNDHINR